MYACLSPHMGRSWSCVTPTARKWQRFHKMCTPSRLPTKACLMTICTWDRSRWSRFRISLVCLLLETGHSMTWKHGSLKAYGVSPEYSRWPKPTDETLTSHFTLDWERHNSPQSRSSRCVVDFVALSASPMMIAFSCFRSSSTVICRCLTTFRSNGNPM